MDPLQAKAELDIQERISILPPELIAPIIDGTLDAVVFGIQQKYSLSSTQTSLLENEIIFVLTLFFSADEFVSNIERSLEIEKNIAEAIGKEVTTGVFELVDDILFLIKNAKKEAELGKNQEEIFKTLEKKNTLRSLAESFKERAPDDNQSMEQRQSDTEVLEPLRTMQSDISRIHGYGAYYETLEAQKNAKDSVVSSQETLLKKDSE